MLAKIILVFVALAAFGHAQPASASPTLAQMYHTGWTVREGAPRAIYSIAVTSDGFLWLATGDGLFRFDGQSFERYQPRSGDAFPGSFITALQATSDGGLWIGYGGEGASFLRQGRNLNYGEHAGLERATVLAFAIDAENTVWAAANADLKRLEGSSWKTVGKEWNFPEKVSPQTVFVDTRGTLWVGTLAGSFYLRKGEHAFRPVADLTGAGMRFAESANGVIWLRTYPGSLQALDPVTATLRRDIAPIVVETRGMSGGRDGSLWITTVSQGITRIQNPEKSVDFVGPDGNNTQQFKQLDGLTSDFSFMAVEDREGSMWIATTKGLDQFRAPALTALTPPHGATEESIGSAEPGRVFWGAAIVEVSSGRVLAPAPPSISNITVIYRDPLGAVWFGGRTGLWSYVDRRFTAYPLPADLGVEHPVQGIAMDRAGGLWVSFVRNGVYRFFQNRWSRATNLLAAPDNSATAITVDSRGRIWFAYAQSNQIQCLDGDRPTTFVNSDGVDVGVATAIAEINGQIVIGGDVGLEMLDGKRFRHLRLTNSAQIRLVTGLLQQKNGDVWINEASGILHIDAREIKEAQSEANIPMQFTRYDYRDGVDDMSPARRPRPTVVDGGDGHLYFATRTSAIVIDTTHLERNLLPPAVEIESLSDGAKEYPDLSKLVLPPNTDQVTIRYTASSLLIPQRVQFRYRLDGIDEAWQPGNPQRLAVYSRLPPGNFTFHVIASNNDGVWNNVGASVGFTIPPSFIQSRGFKALCIASAIALLWLAYQFRLRQITAQIQGRLYERLEERTRIARDLHDTFIQAVQGLILRFNTGTSLLKKDEPARVIFEEALEQSDRVMLEGRELMLDLRAGVSTTAELADALSLIGDDLKKAHPTDFRVTVIGDPRRLHPIVFEELHRFGREALSNAFRHAHAKTIEAELHYERNQLRVRVRDDGFGIEAEVLSRGYRVGHWGLPGMRERAKKLGGHVDIWSRANAGTEIELRVPAAAAYGSKPKR